MPLTRPEEFTVALPLLALHAPPVAVSVNVNDVPVAIEDTPEIGAGVPFTVTTTLVPLVEHPLAPVAVNVYTPLLPVATPLTPVLKEVGEVIAVPPGVVHK